MTFLWPWALACLLLVPLGVLAYAWLGRWRTRRAATLGGFGIGPSSTGAAPTRRPARRIRWREVIPAASFVGGFLLLAFAAARPQGTLAVPRLEGTVILAFDVSGSMAADDLQPTRMDAAKAASRAFVEKQPAGVVIGVVAFTDSGLSVQAPSDDPATVLAAIDRLQPKNGTALAGGILTSLDAIDLAEHGQRTDYYTNPSPGADAAPTPVPVPPGSHGSAVIVLLTDGENNENPDPVQAAQAAADRGIRIDTVGLGSPDGTTLDLDGFRVHTQLNAALLQQISQMTAGTYYPAADAESITQAYDQLAAQLVVKQEPIELTAAFGGLGLAALAFGAITSLAWLGRIA